MNPGRSKSGEDELKEPKKKKIKPETALKDPYPIIFWNKLGIPPCNDLWPEYNGIFDGECVLVEDPEDINEIYTKGYFGKRMLYRKGNEGNVGEIPVVRERQWKTRVEWAANFGYVLISNEGDSPKEDANPPEYEDSGNVSQDVKSERSNKNEDIRGEIKDDAKQACKSKDIEEKKENIMEDIRLCNKSDDENDEEELESKKDRKHEVGNIINANASENLGGNDEDINYVQTDERNSKSCMIELLKDSSKIAVGDDGENNADGHAKSDGNASNSQKTALEVDVTNLEKGSIKEPKMGKECPIAPSTNDGTETVGSELEEKADDKEEEDWKKLKAENAVLGKGEKDEKTEAKNILKVKSNENEELKNSDGGNHSPLKNHSMRNESSGKGNSISPTEEVVEDLTENEESVETDVGNEEKQCVRICDKEDKPNLNDSAVPVEILDCDLVKESANDESDGTDDANKEKRYVSECDKEDKPNLNDSAVSLEILDCDLVKESANVSKCDKEDKPNLNDSAVSVEILDCNLVKESANEESDGTDDGNKEKRYVRECDKEDKPNLNDLAVSVEMLDCDLVNESANEECCEKFDKELKSSSLKRSVDEVSPIIEFCGEIGLEGNMETKRNERDHAAKKMRTTELVILDTKEGNKMLLVDDVKNSDKQNKLEDGKNVRELQDKNNFVSTSSPVDGSMLNDSNDCEIMEIKDEETLENERDSISKPKFTEGNVRWLDSDEDIMEVSMEEVEIKENRNRNCAYEGKKKGSVMSALQTKDTETNIKLQNILTNTQKKLSSDIEIMDVSKKEATLKGSDSNNVDAGKNKETVDENEDDDVIEIDLQKSDMLDLEDCIEDDSVGCEVSNHHENFQRRIKRESSGFKRKDRVAHHADDDTRPDEVEEIEDKQSLIGQVKLESECDVIPCIVVPDSDSEDENPEVQGCPKLECDPSLYLPSLDVLRLLPEEAFFLAYGLGCLQVWDGRNMEVFAEDVEAKLLPDESLDNEHYDLVQVKSKLSDKGNSVEKEEKDHDKNALSSKNMDFESSTKPCKGSLSNDGNNSEHISKVRSESLESSSLESTSITSATNVNVSGEKSIKPSFGKKGGFKLNEVASINPNLKKKSDMNTNQVRENGVNSNIAFIDLADSPPSRQWANRDGWSSDDQDDIIAMDCDNTIEEALDCKQSTNHLLNSTNMNMKNCSEGPLSLLDLWNTLRSSRTATSPFAIPFETTYAVYHHFRAKRWVVKPGLRFGGDFLLYKDGPPFYHASYLVIIESVNNGEKSRLTWNTLAGRNRLAENVAKELMICRVEWPQSLTEEELQNPKCLAGLTVQEILLRRWVSNKEREESEEYPSGKDEDFIPLEL